MSLAFDIAFECALCTSLCLSRLVSLSKSRCIAIALYVFDSSSLYAHVVCLCLWCVLCLCFVSVSLSLVALATLRVSSCVCSHSRSCYPLVSLLVCLRVDRFRALATPMTVYAHMPLCVYMCCWFAIDCVYCVYAPLV